MLSISDKNEVIWASWLSDKVDLCTDEGKLKMTMELPAGHVVHVVAFHLIVPKIIVLSSLGYSVFLHSYSETGKLENSAFLFKKKGISRFTFAMTSHPSGPVAVVERESITYI